MEIVVVGREQPPLQLRDYKQRLSVQFLDSTTEVAMGKWLNLSVP